VPLELQGLLRKAKNNMVAIKKNIFICSTVKNFRYLRQTIANYIERSGHMVYANELAEFPVEGNLHPMDECLEIVRKKATHFILLLGDRWGLPYYKDPSLSITEKEYFEAVERSLPVLCFIEDITWNEAISYHTMKKEGLNYNSVPFFTDSRVLKFIDKHLMHSNVKWITPFSNIQDIFKKLASSWLVCETRPYSLFLLRDNEEAFLNSVSEYASAFVAYFDKKGLPIPLMDLPEKDRKYIAAHRANAHKIGKDSYIDALNRWVNIFEEIRNRVNIALHTAYNFILKARIEKFKIDFDFHYPCKLNKLISKCLENYLDFSRMHFYASAYGAIPQMIGGWEISEKPIPVDYIIHSKLNCNNDDLLFLKASIQYNSIPINAYIPIFTFKAWQDYYEAEYFSEYNKFLIDWATIIIPQAIAFTDELSEQFIEILLLNCNDITGSTKDVHIFVKQNIEEYLGYLHIKK